MKNVEFKSIISNLEKSTTEEEIVENLTSIVKGFNINSYRNIILSNPYYRSLIIDVREKIKIEISNIKETIISEISEIDKEILKTNNSQLKDLKRECVSLLYEISERERDLNNLI
jgi:biotin-(acetyl-CoA carboxylase) ligase